MSLPTSQKLEPESINSLPPARRRRQRRMPVPNTPDERNEFLLEISQRIIPSFDFFLFSFFAGIVFGVAAFFDSVALLVLTALMAPFMSPLVGLSLGTILGSVRFFTQSLGAILLGSLLVFGGGALAGILRQFFPAMPVEHVLLRAHFSWADLLVLTLGAALTAFLLVQKPEQKPVAASIALAYELYLPIGAAGFGLSAGVPGLWPDAFLVFVVHLAWAGLVGTAILAVLGFRPMGFLGYGFGTSLALMGLAALMLLSGVGTALNLQIAMPPVPPTLTLTATVTPSATSTPLPPTLTQTPTNTLIPSKTPTITLSPVPTPVWAKINAGEYNGALIRKEPSPTALVVKSLLNGMLVEVLPEVTENQSITWVHVRTTDGIEGWIVRGLLVTATPQPGW